MMVHMDRATRDIVSMPRGGPDASWLDRRLQTDRLEYLDRDDVDDPEAWASATRCPEFGRAPAPT